jgi:hypothetical protein
LQTAFGYVFVSSERYVNVVGSASPGGGCGPDCAAGAPLVAPPDVGIGAVEPDGAPPDSFDADDDADDEEPFSAEGSVDPPPLASPLGDPPHAMRESAAHARRAAQPFFS